MFGTRAAWAMLGGMAILGVIYFVARDEAGSPAPEFQETAASARRLTQLEAEVKALKALYAAQQKQLTQLSLACGKQDGPARLQSVAPALQSSMQPQPNRHDATDASRIEHAAVANKAAAELSSESLNDDEPVKAVRDPVTGEVVVNLAAFAPSFATAEDDGRAEPKIFFDIDGKRYAPADLIADADGRTVRLKLPREQAGADAEIRVDIQTRQPDGRLMGTSIPVE